MKFSKLNLNKVIEPHMVSLGFVSIKDSITGSDGLYIKKQSNGLFFVIGIVISKYYKSHFTASSYLSRVTRWGSIWGDIPKDSYMRIAKFLDGSQRKELLDDDYNGGMILDGWWDFNKDNSIERFIKTISIVENKIKSSYGLIDEINKSRDVLELEQLAKKVIFLVNLGDFKEIDFNFIPNKEIDNIPQDWFKASEIVLKNSSFPINSNTVKHLAADSYRMFQFIN